MNFPDSFRHVGKDCQFEAVLICDHCDYDGIALYRKPTGREGVYENIVMDTYRGKILEGGPHKCPSCFGGLTRKYYVNGKWVNA